MSSTFLIDANVLIALTYTDHEHHDRAQGWVSEVGRFAVCPVVEGALVRFLVRAGEGLGTVQTVLDGLTASPRCDFWPDAISYGATDLSHVVGHRQVTDAYLVSLAAHNGAVLVTFDRALAKAWPDRVVLIS